MEKEKKLIIELFALVGYKTLVTAGLVFWMAYIACYYPIDGNFVPPLIVTHGFIIVDAFCLYYIYLDYQYKKDRESTVVFRASPSFGA
jgi:hypothetical protein